MHLIRLSDIIRLHITNTCIQISNLKVRPITNYILDPGLLTGMSFLCVIIQKVA